MAQPAGTVLGLSLRATGTAAPAPVPAVRAVTGHGLAGDRHADSRSPRQVLLAGAGAYAELALPAHTLRENLLLDIDTAGLESGVLLRVGAAAILRLSFPCEACGALTARVGGSPRSLLARRGMLARVESGGEIRVGDAVAILDGRRAALPADWRARVAMVLEAVPAGMAIGYADLARVAGIQSSYCRAFPRVLAALGPERAARAVPARADNPLPRWDGARFFD
ncbi:MAG: MOSC domain-containing protein [Janthinobacterium lividum]